MISIQYNPTSLDDFKAAVEFLSERGISSQAPKVSAPPVKVEPNVRKYLEITGDKRFRLTEEEAGLVNNGVTRDEIAAMRLVNLGDVPSSPESEEPQDSGFSLFGDGAEDEKE